MGSSDSSARRPSEAEAPLLSDASDPLGSNNDEAPELRRVAVGATPADGAGDFPDNRVTSAKYNVATFLPLVLFNQFRRLANVYFVYQMILQMIPAISITNGVPTMALPLAFVLSVSILKELVEDVRRHRADAEINNRQATVLGADGRLAHVRWHELRVGDVVQVQNREPIPADLVMLVAFDGPQLTRSASCYVETKSLDGETDLKVRRALPATVERCATREAAAQMRATVECEAPNNRITSFLGNLELEDGSVEALGLAQVLMRGTTLRNTAVAYGVVVYTGHDTKVFQNAAGTRHKQSRVERTTNRLIVGVLAAQQLVCLLLAVISAHISSDFSGWWYTAQANGAEAGDSTAMRALRMDFTFQLLSQNAVPISLYVSLEVVKFVQAWFIEWDLTLYHAESDTPALVRTSNLNEELGQVTHVFSDKTGTLTRNTMDFVKCSVGGVVYGEGGRQERGPNLNFDATDARFAMGSRASAQGQAVAAFFQHLALCHTCNVEEDTTDDDDQSRPRAPSHASQALGPQQQLRYTAASPDELALVAGARAMGFEFVRREVDRLDMRVHGDLQTAALLHVLEFNSTRKRMSVVVRLPDGRLELLCKGADTTVLRCLREPASEGERQVVRASEQQLSLFASEGLRTLCVATRTLDAAEYAAWAERYQAATTSPLQLQRRLQGEPNDIDALQTELEQGLVLLGVTAVEDKLQAGVPDAIERLLDANAKLWVLTGDKQETAINIGFSCGVLKPAFVPVVVNEASPTHTLAALRRGARELDPSRQHALIIDGASLEHARDCLDELYALASRCRTVVLCRSSPKQKAQVVRLVQRNDPRAITLAIGDGGNDVSMIEAAHVGVGISGHEGLQAVNASDYAVAQFAHLAPLMLVHGRWAYRRIALLVRYMFYKNIVFVVTAILYSFDTGFTGQTLFTDADQQLFNIVFTCLPVLILAVLDRDVSAATAMAHPELYRLSQADYLFSRRRLVASVLVALYHSGLLYLLVRYYYADSVWNPDGKVLGLTGFGMTVFACLVVVVNGRLLMDCYSWFWFQQLAVAASILSWFVTSAVQNASATLFPSEFGVLTQLCKSPKFWWAFLGVPVAVLVRDWAWKMWKRSFDPELDHVIQERERLQRFSSAEDRDLPPHLNRLSHHARIPSDDSSINSGNGGPPAHRETVDEVLQRLVLDPEQFAQWSKAARESYDSAALEGRLRGRSGSTASSASTTASTVALGV